MIHCGAEYCDRPEGTVLKSELLMGDDFEHRLQVDSLPQTDSSKSYQIRPKASSAVQSESRGLRMRGCNSESNSRRRWRQDVPAQAARQEKGANSLFVHFLF